MLRNKMHYIYLGALRRVDQYNPDRNEAKRRARLAPTIYGCSICSTAICERFTGPTEDELEVFTSRGVELRAGKMEIDHAEPVIDPQTGFIDWNTYMSRLDCGASGRQAICKCCHYLKTQMENSVRKSLKEGEK